MLKEIDGPPCAFFTEKDEKIIYRTIALGSNGNFASLAAEFERRLNVLKDIGGQYSSVLVWRQRPITTMSPDEPGKYFVSARLAFYPDLTNEQWNDAFRPKPEGGDIEMIDKVVPI